MATSISAVSGADGYQASTASSSGNSSLDLVGKDAFLKLLVAQIKNQNPLNPADGVQFLSQLAQFSQLEQLMDIRSQVDTLAASGQKTGAQTAGPDQTAAV